MTTMRVSVIVPCYNAGPYLSLTLGSALDQTHLPHEVIVVDDGSTDGSLAVALDWESRYPERVHVFTERSGRASRTRNLGALVATGDALLFLDADDLIGPGTVEALADALSRRPAGVAICPWFRLECRDGDWQSRHPSCAPRRAGEPPLSAWLRGWYHPPCAVLWSRAAFERAGRWDERATVNDDGDLMMRALATGTPLIETGAGAAFYRRRADGAPSLTAARLTRDALADRLRVIRKIARWIEARREGPIHRDALCEAFHRIAADAGAHPDLRAEALVCARRYAPPFWTKVRRRVVSQVGVRRGVPGARAARDAACPSPPVAAWPAAGLGAGRPVAAARVRAIGRPAVSAIVPTYNRAALVRRAIDSVLAQSFEDVELLVVDDGSTDGTRDVVAGYADPRVRYVPQEKAGVAAARNRGMREARAGLIAFLDSDDEWLPGKLARQVERLASLPERVGLVYTGVENVYEDGSTRIVRATASGHIHADMLARNRLHGGSSNVMIRRSVVASAGFFHEGLPAIEDYEYWLRVTRDFEVVAIDEPLIRYYDPGSLERRSLALQANLEARWWLYREHAAEMRRARAAHLFLLKGVRRALGAAQPDVRAARRLAARAVFEAPTSRLALATLAQVLVARAPASAAARRPMETRSE